MDALGIPSLVTKTTNVEPRSSAQSIPLPKATQEASVPVATSDFGDLDAKRVETLTKAATQIADVYAAGDRRFSIFKGSTGEYIVRYTSLRDGSVTYVPEPDILSLANKHVVDTKV